MFNDMLGDIVAELVDDKGSSTSVKLCKYGASRRLLAVLQHTLYDTAAVRVCRQRLDLASEGVDDELYVLSRYPLDGFLDHVIAILIFDAIYHVILELFDKLSLLIGEDVLESLGSLANVTVLVIRRPTFCTTLQPYICFERLRM